MQGSDSTFAQLVEQGVRAYQAAHNLKLIGMTVAYVAEAAGIGPSTLDTWRSQRMRRVPRDYRVLVSFTKVCVEAAPELGEGWVRSLFLAAGMAGYCDHVIAEIFGLDRTHSDRKGRSIKMRESKAHWRRTSLRLGKSETAAPARIMPSLPSHYVPRTPYLEELKTRIRELHQTGGYIPMIGMTGIGKTTLMAAVVHDPEICELFAHRMHWLELHRGKGLFNLLQHIAASLTSSAPESLRCAQAEIEAIRTQLGERSVLLLVDDVRDLGQAEVLKELGPNIVSVITTRKWYIATSLSSSSQDLLSVGKMTEAEAWEMVDSISPVLDEQRGAAEAVARLADHHPCALATLASAARTLQMTWKEIEAAFQSPSARSILLHVDSAEQRSLWTGLEADWNALDRRYQEALQTLVHLPETITYNVATARAAWRVDAMTAAITLKTLAAMHLMVPSDSPGQSYTLHWLVRDYVQEKTCTTADQTLTSRCWA